MSHVVLLGDSIFDNAAYVPDRPPVIEQVRRGLPSGWKATLIAVDGHTVQHVPSQLGRIPQDATHFVLSIGGNNALMSSSLLGEPARTVRDGFAQVASELERFRRAYAEMLGNVLALGKPTCICTVYDTIPTIGEAERTALAGFNDVILRAAVITGIPLIDLRVICNHMDDYSAVSPIEPSVVGGAKIADVICRVLIHHDFAAKDTVVYT